MTTENMTTNLTNDPHEAMRAGLAITLEESGMPTKDIMRTVETCIPL